MARDGPAAARGHAFGRAHAAEVANTVRTYRRLLMEAAGASPADLTSLGGRVAGTVAAHWPDLVEEVEGVASGAGQDASELLALNARTELLGPMAEGECSLIGRRVGDRVRLAQNWDWHPALRASRVIVTARAGDGPRYTTVTEAGILAKLGLNRAGVAIGLNFLTCSNDGGVAGVPVHILLRVLLDRCRGAVDALELLLNARVSASSCVSVAVAEAHGSSLFAVELSPGGASVVWPDADGRLLHTNHFLSPPRSGVDTQPAAHPSTLARLDALRHGADLASHFPAGPSICRHDDERLAWAERRATLLSLEADPAGQTLRIAPGTPCDTPFEDVELPA